jgi:hypothetical protein
VQNLIGFDVVVFDLLNPTTKEMNDFEKREEEFNIIIQCPFIDEYNTTGSGLLCTAGSDEAFQKKWGMNLFNTKYVKHDDKIERTEIWHLNPSHPFPY